MSLTVSTPVDALAQLKAVRQSVIEQFGFDEPLSQAALSLIDSTTEVVSQLPGGDLSGARQALGSARAAVVSASYAVYKIHELTRLEQA